MPIVVGRVVLTHRPTTRPSLCASLRSVGPRAVRTCLPPGWRAQRFGQHCNFPCARLTGFYRYILSFNREGLELAGVRLNLFSYVHVSFMFRSCYNDCVRRTIRVDTERLRQLRREQALSQRALARASGVGLDTVNKVETGVRDALPVTLRKLADALGVEPRELMKGE
jgi:DNA-binding transcriptional regulator YiaG